MALRLFLLKPAVVFRARVNQSSFTYPLAEVTYDGVTAGAFGDIEPGMTVLFGTMAGLDDMGRQRIRKAATADTIYIGRSSQGVRDGEVWAEDNGYITVLDDYRVWAKVPYIDGEGNVFKDHDLEAGDNTSAIPPKANIGPGGAYGGTVGGGGVVTVAFDGSGSAAKATGATIAGYAWDVADGTITVGTAASAAITATFPAGFRWVKLTVTDSNGKTHYQRYPVYARDAAGDDTLPFQIGGHQIRPQGQRLAVTLLADAPATEYPDGTLAMVLGGEPEDESDRSNVLFWGWHQSDPAAIRGERTGTLADTSLELLDVAGRLATLPGFPQSVERKATPASWLEMAGANMDRYMDYLLRWHSTALEMAWWEDSGTGDGYPFVVLGSDGESLFDQVARRAAALVPDHIFGCDRAGRLLTRVDPQLQDTSERTTASQATLGAADWSDIQYTRQRPPRYHWHRGNAILASETAIVPVFCIAPGETPGQGLSPNERGEQLAQSQAALNIQEGHRYARLNAVDGLYTITLAGGDDRGIDPAAMTWVKVTIPTAVAARRGLSFDSARGLPQELNIRYGHGRTGVTREVTLTWERETNGTPATTWVLPDDGGLPPDDWTPPDWEPGPEPTPGGGFGTVYALTEDALGRTRDFSAASPEWVDIAAAIGSLYDFILDPWAPSTRGFLATAVGVFRSENLDADTPTWEHVFVSGTSRPFPKLVASINREGFVACFYVSGNTIFAIISEDGGDTWATNLVSSNFSSVSNCAGEMLDHLIGGHVRLYTAHNTLSGRQLILSTDSGASWSTKAIAGGASSAAISLHTPYDDNADGRVIFVSLSSGSWWTETGGDTWTLISDGVTAAKDGIGTYTQNRLRVYLWKDDNTFWTSEDGGQSWTQRAAAGVSGDVRAAGGFPTSGDQYYVLTTAGIFVSTDGGETFIDKTGDWAFGFDLPLNTGTIVPDWTE
jgi:hypothetical protein